MCWEHCPNCLVSVHEADEEGCECGGTLLPVSIWVKPDDSWNIIQRCSLCGELVSTPMSEDDSPMKLMAIAMRPYGSEPISKINVRNMTASMETQG